MRIQYRSPIWQGRGLVKPTPCRDRSLIATVRPLVIVPPVALLSHPEALSECRGLRRRSSGRSASCTPVGRRRVLPSTTTSEPTAAGLTDFFERLTSASSSRRGEDFPTVAVKLGRGRQFPEIAAGYADKLAVVSIWRFR